MVLGFIIATGIETGLELGFWTFRKAASGVYYMIYGANDNTNDNANDTNDNANDNDKDNKISESELNELKQEMVELKVLLQNINSLNVKQSIN